MDEDLVLIDENPSMTLVASPSSDPHPPPPRSLPILVSDKKQKDLRDSALPTPPKSTPNAFPNMTINSPGFLQERNCLHVPPPFSESNTPRRGRLSCHGSFTSAVRPPQHATSVNSGSARSWLPPPEGVFIMPSVETVPMPPPPPPAPQYHIQFGGFGKKSAVAPPPVSKLFSTVSTC